MMPSHTETVLRWLQSQKTENKLVLLEASFVNYTPVMIGDYDGYSFAREGEPARPIVAQALRGKARWLARTIMASMENCTSYSRSEKAYCKIEKECCKVETSAGKFGLVELLFGRIGEKSLSSPFSISVRLEYLGKRAWTPARRNRYYNRYHAIIVRSVKEEEIKRMLAPVAPNTMRLHVQVKLAPHAYRLIRDRDKLGKLAAFYTGLVLAVPLLLGLGKAANRGFGRFKLEEYHASDPIRDSVKGLVSSLDRLQRSKSEKEAREAAYALIEALLKLGEEAAEDAKCRVRREQMLAIIPRLVNSIAHGNINLPTIEVVATHARSIDDAIELIAASVLKSKWKSYLGEGLGSGLAFHTWPLGLPRSSKIKCTCSSRYGAEDGKLRYGYFVLPDTREPNDCDHALVCIEASTRSSSSPRRKDELAEQKVSIGGAEFKARDVRHQSMIVLFPLPEPSLIVVVPFFTSALAMLLDPEVVEDTIEITPLKYRLYHVGGHFVKKRSRRNKHVVKPCCNRHVVNVSMIMSTPEIPPPPLQGKKEDECDCGGDPGGIAWPKAKRSEQKAKGSKQGYPIGKYLDVLRAAYEWVVEMLRSGGSSSA